MADITNPEAIAFCNNQIRPIAEKIRGLKIEIDAALTKWNSGIGTIIGNSAGDNIIDNRENEGTSRLTSKDITDLGIQMIAIKDLLEVAGVPETISKPCVRSVTVN